MSEYRDIGQLNSAQSEALLVNNTRYSQVYQATHEGERRLPFMNRSFISFSYGGKNIEDFNLIATVSGDRWSSKGYANFDDLTSSYDVINGQFYWNTYFHTNDFDFELSTDGINQLELDEFMRWFKPGLIKELILAEHPNRAILARVDSVPSISMIPFELKKLIKLDGQIYEVSTTEYKGTINLSLVSDDPFWYAKINVFGHFDASVIYSDWVNANGDEVSDLLNDPDILKIVFEDGIPLSSMVKDTIALGGSVYATVDADMRSRVADIVTEEAYNAAGGENNTDWYGAYTPPGETDPIYYHGASISEEGVSIEYATGITAGAQMNSSSNITMLAPYSIDSGNYIYFYYPGTAPSPLTIEFDFFPQIDSQTYFILTPNNHFALNERDINFGKPYNSIWIESIHLSELKFTTPNIYTSYNQVINMFNTHINSTWIEIRTLIRDTIHHQIIRAWANLVIDKLIDSDGEICTIENCETAKEEMSLLFMNPTDGVDETLKAHIMIDSKSGESVGKFMFREMVNDEALISISTENIQDMFLSNNLIIKDRNFFNDEGNVVKWLPTNITTRSYSHVLYHDMPGPIYNILLVYENLYL